ncbi:MAG: translation initiation factor IF-6 [Candidatus Woesearchaeota archaeon]
MVHVIRLAFSANPNIGLYAYTTDTRTLVGESVTQKETHSLSEALQTSIYHMSICGTSLLGIFLIGKDDILCVPDIAFDHEVQALEKMGFTVTKIPTRFTALANNVFIHGDILLANKDMEEVAVELIAKTCQCSTIKRIHVADTDVVGSSIVATKNGGLVHYDMSDEQIEQLEKLLDIPLTPATVNNGSPYIKSAIICNTHGFAIGTASTGPEIVNADEGLGFIQK